MRFLGLFFLADLLIGACAQQMIFKGPEKTTKDKTVEISVIPAPQKIALQKGTFAFGDTILFVIDNPNPELINR